MRIAEMQQFESWQTGAAALALPEGRGTACEFQPEHVYESDKRTAGNPACASAVGLAAVFAARGAETSRRSVNLCPAPHSEPYAKCLDRPVDPYTTD